MTEMKTLGQSERYSPSLSEATNASGLYFCRHGCGDYIGRRVGTDDWHIKSEGLWNVSSQDFDGDLMSTLSK